MKSCKVMIVAHGPAVGGVLREMEVGKTLEMTRIRSDMFGESRYAGELTVCGRPNHYVVNPMPFDEDLTVRCGEDRGDVMYVLQRISKASQRKLLVRAFKMIARHRGWTDAQVRKGGNFANIADWARNWADWYFDRNGSFVSTHTNWRYGTEHDPVNGEQWYEFAEAEIDNQ